MIYVFEVRDQMVFNSKQIVQDSLAFAGLFCNLYLKIVHFSFEIDDGDRDHRFFVVDFIAPGCLSAGKPYF